MQQSADHRMILVVSSIENTLLKVIRLTIPCSQHEKHLAGGEKQADPSTNNRQARTRHSKLPNGHPRAAGSEAAVLCSSHKVLKQYLLRMSS